MTTTPPTEQRPWEVLRRFARPRPAVERCELCGAGLAPEHPHLLEPSSRQLRCCCEACSILFSGRQDAHYRKVPPRVDALTDFQLSDQQWEDLHLPINLAFFVRGSAAGRVQAYFPSPAGATESLLTFEAWDDLAAENPVLCELEPDVEALLVNRLSEPHQHYRVSIDECYKLVGLIRKGWKGLSGGTAVWEEIGRFFASINERARPRGGASHARPEL
jgi:hypothetical protein